MSHLNPHGPCCCEKAPFVGARYRRMSRDIFTGKEKGWRYYTVTDVEPNRQDRTFCRRVTITGEDGRSWHPFVQDLFRDYEALDNVVPLTPTPAPRG